MYPIVMVSNFSGNVGKTTITKSLLAPNMLDVRIFAVEDVNAGYGQGEAVQLSAEQTASILEQVIEASLGAPVIVDVGASNVSNFFAALAGYDGMHEYISAVVVPTEPSDKVQTDTVSTLDYLINNLLFDANKISLVLNKVPGKIPAETIFAKTLAHAEKMGVRSAGEIPESETFQVAAALGKTIHELSELNPKELLAQSRVDSEAGKDPKAGVKMMLAAASAKKLRTKLDEVFMALCIEG